jgi:transcriptional regulator with XRE-family HTH domain
MRPPRRPPIDGDAILAARLAKGMTQEEVQAECFRRGTKVCNLSRMENGDIKWPAPKVLPVLASVLALEVSDLFEKVEVAA